MSSSHCNGSGDTGMMVSTHTASPWLPQSGVHGNSLAAIDRTMQHCQKSWRLVFNCWKKKSVPICGKQLCDRHFASSCKISSALTKMFWCFADSNNIHFNVKTGSTALEVFSPRYPHYLKPASEKLKASCSRQPMPGMLLLQESPQAY